MAVIDRTTIDELLDLCDHEDQAFLAELVGIFLRDAPARIGQACDAASSGDFDRAERAAHALRGSAGNLGAVVLQDLATRLQAACRERDRTRVERLAGSLGPALSEAASALDEIVSRAEPD
jgi:HPt (histidine-containing phosphotransfer) domain-containing protein